MKTRLLLIFAAAAMLFTGCATSTIETRRAERVSAYSNLAQDLKESVDQGQIKVGMPMDAVYIAWGKPKQVLASESPSGPLVTWLYNSSYLQGYTHWDYPGHFGPCHPYYFGPGLTHGYVIIDYVSAEVIFDGGLVQSWRQLPRP